MNQMINLKFARKIMVSCGLDQKAAHFANLPAFISGGLFHGSMFTHALSNLPDLLEVTGDIFSSMEKTGHNIEKTRKALDTTLNSTKQSIQSSNNYMERHFYTKRLLIYENVLTRLDDISDQYKKMTEPGCLPTSNFFKENQQALLLSLVSFIYSDLWIAPRQIFSPKTAVCSGAWSLWDAIDTIQLAERFLIEEGDEHFGASLFEDSFWSEKFDGFAMLKALIIRMGEMGSPCIPYSIVDWNIRILFRYLGVNDYKKADTELNFLKNNEARLEALFLNEFNRQ